MKKLKGVVCMKKIIMNMIEDGSSLILGINNTEVEVSKKNIIKSDEEKLIVIDNHLVTILYLDTVEYFKFK